MFLYQVLSCLLIHGVISMQASENNKENVKVIFQSISIALHATRFFYTIINNTFIASLRSCSRDC